MKPIRWTVTERPPEAAVAELAARLNIPPTLAILLAQRGWNDLDEAKRFLRPTLDDLTPPDRLTDLTKAVEVIVAHVRAGDAILVHGDYDVDGQCASALLTRALREAGANVHAFVPHRLRDGYDFGHAGLQRARDVGAKLIITCDCGISAVEPVRAAMESGLDVIVTDHHLLGDEVPAATAVVNPRRPDSLGADQGLCGAGVAFKLVQGLIEPLDLPPTLPLHLLDYVALATVADLVPLVGENRVLVRHGLKVLSQSRWAGLRALVSGAGLASGPLRTGQVGYILAPRLNAVGRVADANDGLRLLLSDDAGEAEELAQRLENLNTHRQDLDRRALAEAIDEIEGDPEHLAGHALVLDSPAWHAGVIGIVASRIVERYARPTILIAWDEQGSLGKGSGRSIPPFHLRDGLASCAHYLERFGGHRMAAGLTIHRDQVAAFRQAFRDVAGDALTTDDLTPTQRVDLEVGLDALNEDLVRLARHLEPCGIGNPAPVFGVRRARVERVQNVKGHLKFQMRDDGASLDAIAFGWADRVDHAWWDGPVDVAFKLELNRFGGRETLQARVQSLAPAVS